MRRGCEAAKKSSRKMGPSSSWSTCFMCYGSRSIPHSYGASTDRSPGDPDHDDIQANSDAERRGRTVARKKLKPGADKRDKLIADQAVALAEFAAKVLIAAEQLRIKTKPVE